MRNKVGASLQVRASRGLAEDEFIDDEVDGNELCLEMRNILKRHHERMLSDISKKLENLMESLSKDQERRRNSMAFLPLGTNGRPCAICTAPVSTRGPGVFFNANGTGNNHVVEDSHWRGKASVSGTVASYTNSQGTFASDYRSSQGSAIISRLDKKSLFSAAASFAQKMGSLNEPGQSDMRRKTRAMDMQVVVMKSDEGNEKHSAFRRFLLRIVYSDFFELFFASMIISNSVFIGIQVEHAAAHRNEIPREYVFVQYIYTGIFLLELVCRIGAERLDFFTSSQWHWNFLDCFIVGSSLAEVFLNAMASATNIRIIRITRITRLLRVFRVIRVVRFIHALRTLVYSIVCTMKSLIWAMLLLLLIIYIFGILFTQSVSDHLFKTFEPDDEYPPSAAALVKYWSLLPRSMFTLFKSITGGVSWDIVVDPLSDVSWVWVGTFAAFISFCFLAVLNVVTGVFCQSAIETAQQNEDLIIQSQIQNKKMYVERIRKCFSEIDTDASGYITIAEFEKHLEKGAVQAYFASLDLDTEDAWTLFKLLDQDEGNLIDIEEFVVGCMRLKGNAKSVDIAKLHHEQKRLYNMLLAFIQYQEERNEELDKFLRKQEETMKTNSFHGHAHWNHAGEAHFHSHVSGHSSHSHRHHAHEHSHDYTSEQTLEPRESQSRRISFNPEADIHEQSLPITSNTFSIDDGELRQSAKSSIESFRVDRTGSVTDDATPVLSDMTSRASSSKASVRFGETALRSE